MTADGRNLLCTRCGEQVLVYEIPRPWIDPNLYVCGQCLKPSDGLVQTALELEQALRTEERRYDPQQSLIPY